MALVEINFDGIVGPSHNYAGLSLGNLASARNAGRVSLPARGGAAGAGARCGTIWRWGWRRGCSVPLPRPNARLSRRAGRAARTARLHGGGLVGQFDVDRQCRDCLARARYRRRALPPDRRQPGHHAAPLAGMARHAAAVAARLCRRRALRGPRRRPALLRRRRRGQPHAAGRRAMARRGSRCSSTARSGGAFPARQHEQASRAVARLPRARSGAHRCSSSRTRRPSRPGAFHNDVVAVANERVLFTHEQAFADPEGTYAAIRARLPEAEIVVVPASAVSLADAIKSYLFNAQLVTLPERRAWRWSSRSRPGSIRACGPGSTACSPATARSGGCCRSMSASRWPMAAARPACGCGWWPIPATVDPRFLLDEAKLDADRSGDRRALARDDRSRLILARRRWPRRSSPRGWPCLQHWTLANSPDALSAVAYKPPLRLTIRLRGNAAAGMMIAV